MNLIEAKGLTKKFRRKWRLSLFVLAGFLGLALLLAIWSLKTNDQR
ncbi:hypothetical protein [Acetobacterium wieringae]|nr:hypothetical protein [Acetobacterium wieringae]